MRVLLDTNIVLDFVLERNPFFIEANEIFLKLQNAEFLGYISPITPINVFYTTRKERGKDIALMATEELLKLAEIAETNQKTFQTALLLNFKDYQDAVQCACSVAENLDALITRNVKDFANSSVKVYSPVEFLQLLNLPKISS